MEDNVCRSIKISKEALLEFIYENFINQEEKLFDLDTSFCAYRSKQSRTGKK